MAVVSSVTVHVRCIYGRLWCNVLLPFFKELEVRTFLWNPQDFPFQVTRCRTQEDHKAKSLRFLLLILQSLDCLAAFHLELLQAILFIAVQLSAPVFFQILLLQGCLLQNHYV